MNIDVWENVVDFPDPPATLDASARNLAVHATSLHYILSQDILVVAYTDHGIG